MMAAIYDISSGKIVARVVGPHDCIDIQCRDNQEFYLNCPPEATHIINSEPVTIKPIPTQEQLLSAIRAQRDTKLSACDWTQLPDSVLTPEKRLMWAEYRQALRYFPSKCDPTNPAWPVLPF